MKSLAEPWSGRIARLQAALRERGASFALLAPGFSMLYFSGWSEPGHERFLGLFVPAQGDPAFVVPGLFAQHAAMNPAGISRVDAWADDAGPWAAAVAAAGARDGIAYVDEVLPAGHLLALQRDLPAVRWTGASEVVTPLRAAKGPDELAAMRRAGAMIDEVVAWAADGLRAGVTETDTVLAIAGRLRELGSAPSFSPLVCFGENGAMPHHASGPRALRAGDVVVIDIGCMSGGYPSDTTRTFAFGSPADAEAAAVYNLVWRAHMAARQAARAGTPAQDVDAAARGVIAAGGHGAAFIHRTGHGIGLDVHEEPNIVGGNAAPLVAGNCFSIEPGVYLPGRFGVRIENIYAATAGEPESFNSVPPEQLPVLPVR